MMRKHSLALILYLAISFALLAPFMRIPEAVPGQGVDDPALVWNLWWMRFSLLKLHTAPYFCDYIFFPLGVNLAYYTLTEFNGLISLLFQPFLSLVQSSNFILGLLFAFSAFNTYLLSQYVLRTAENRSAAYMASLLAGAAFAFSATKSVHASFGIYNFLSTIWIPLYVLCWLKWMHSGKLLYALLLGLLFSLNIYCEKTFFIFLTIFSLYAALVWFPVLRRLGWKGAAHLAAAVFVFMLCSLPLFWSAFGDNSTSWVEGWGFADTFSTDLLGFFLPPALHPILGGLEKHFNLIWHNSSFVGWAVLLLTLVALFKLRGQSRPWIGLALLYAIFALGPVLHINGKAFGANMPFDGLLVTWFLPYNLIHLLPILGGMRHPQRFDIMLTLCLALSAGCGAYVLLCRLKAGWTRYSLAAFLIAAVLFEGGSFAIPACLLDVPPIYHKIARDEESSTVLSLPLGWRDGFRILGAQDPQIMKNQYYQTVHHKRIFGGNTSRLPKDVFAYYLKLPIIRSLLAISNGDSLQPAAVEADHLLSAAFLHLFSVRWIVLHPGEHQYEFALYLEQVFDYETKTEENGIIAYHLRKPPGGLSEIHLIKDQEQANLYLGRGWQTMADSMDSKTVFYATDKSSEFYVNMDPAQDARLTLSLKAFTGQQLVVLLNGKPVSEIPLDSNWVTHQVYLPSQLMKNGFNKLGLKFTRLNEFAPSSRTGQKLWSIVAISSGKTYGDEAAIYVNGKDYALNMRGFNIAEIEPDTAKVITTRHFDTHISAEAAHEMASFLHAVPSGHWIAIAIRDEGSRSLTPDALEALKAIGAFNDLRSAFRYGFAWIGIKGTGPIAEDMQKTGNAIAIYGQRATRNRLAAISSDITLAPLAENGTNER